MAPTSPASTTRGARSCHTMAWLMAGVLVWKCRSGTWASSVPTTCDGGTATGPTHSATMEIRIMRTAATATGTQVWQAPGPRTSGTRGAGASVGRAGAVAVTTLDAP